MSPAAIPEQLRLWQVLYPSDNYPGEIAAWVTDFDAEHKYSNGRWAHIKPADLARWLSSGTARYAFITDVGGQDGTIDLIELMRLLENAGALTAMEEQGLV